jgi:hypothetical protein
MNRRRHANLLPITTLATWLLFAAWVTCGGIYYVNCKNDLVDRGSKIKTLEKTLNDLRNANEVELSRIAKLSSPNVLRQNWEADRKFLAGFMPIAQERIVMIPNHSPNGFDLRPVSNDHR